MKRAYFQTKSVAADFLTSIHAAGRYIEFVPVPGGWKVSWE